MGDEMTAIPLICVLAFIVCVVVWAIHTTQSIKAIQVQGVNLYWLLERRSEPPIPPTQPPKPPKPEITRLREGFDPPKGQDGPLPEAHGYVFTFDGGEIQVCVTRKLDPVEICKVLEATKDVG